MESNYYKKYFKYKNKYLNIKYKGGGTRPSDIIKPDGTLINKLRVRDPYSLVINPNTGYPFVDDGDNISLGIAPGRDVPFYSRKKDGITYYGMQDSNGVIVYTDEKDIVIPGENYKYKDGAVVTISKRINDKLVELVDGRTVKTRDIYRLDSTPGGGVAAVTSVVPVTVTPVTPDVSLGPMRLRGIYITKERFTTFSTSKDLPINSSLEYDTSVNVTHVQNDRGDRISEKHGRALFDFKDPILRRGRRWWVNTNDIIAEINKDYELKDVSNFYKEPEKRRSLGIKKGKVTIIDNEKEPHRSLINNMVLCRDSSGKLGWTELSNIKL